MTTVTIGGGGGGGGGGGAGGEGTTTVIADGGSNGLGGGSNPYAQPGRPAGKHQTAQPQQQYKSSGPPLPDPDYSLSESDTEEDNSVRLVRSNLKKVNGGPAAAELNGSSKFAIGGGAATMVNPGMAAETSGNSNTR